MRHRFRHKTPRGAHRATDSSFMSPSPLHGILYNRRRRAATPISQRRISLFTRGRPTWRGKKKYRLADTRSMRIALDAACRFAKSSDNLIRFCVNGCAINGAAANRFTYSQDTAEDASSGDKKRSVPPPRTVVREIDFQRAARRPEMRRILTMTRRLSLLRDGGVEVGRGFLEKTCRFINFFDTPAGQRAPSCKRCSSISETRIDAQMRSSRGSSFHLSKASLSLLCQSRYGLSRQNIEKLQVNANKRSSLLELASKRENALFKIVHKKRKLKNYNSYRR